MNWSAREQCQPRFTQGLPPPAADPSESSRELLESLALPDQRSSTDFKPGDSPLLLPRGAGESPLLSRRSWVQPGERLARCWGCDLGGCPVPAMACQAHAAEILEIFRRNLCQRCEALGRLPLLRVRLEAVCGPSAAVGSTRCWEAPEHPPTAGLLTGLLFLMESEEKVIFPCVVAVCDGRNPLGSWAVPGCQPLCLGSCGCADGTAPCRCFDALRAWGPVRSLADPQDTGCACRPAGT